MDYCYCIFLLPKVIFYYIAALKDAALKILVASTSVIPEYNVDFLVCFVATTVIPGFNVDFWIWFDATSVIPEFNVGCLMFCDSVRLTRLLILFAQHPRD